MIVTFADYRSDKAPPIAITEGPSRAEDTGEPHPEISRLPDNSFETDGNKVVPARCKDGLSEMKTYRS